MRKVLVVVTQEDIDSGSHEAHKCPLSRALTRALEFEDPHDGTGVVGVTHAYFNLRTQGGIVTLPKVAQRWIENYDLPAAKLPLQFPVEPFEFEVEVPNEQA